jgi:sulfate adenylyltransferase
MGAFKEPHGDVLKQLYLPESAAEQEKLRARDYRSWDLTPRQLCDIELILNGAFSPLEGFLSEAEYQRVVREMRLPSGTLWPIPVTLDVSAEFAGATSKGEHIALRDAEGVLIATMEVSDIWEPDKGAEASGVYGTQDQQHPGVYYLMHRAGGMYLGGKLRGPWV